MNIGIIGNGKFGRAVAHLLAKAGDTGFEPVITGLLASARKFDSNTAIFNSGMTAEQIATALGIG